MDAASTHDRDDGPVVTSLSALREAENNAGGVRSTSTRRRRCPGWGRVGRQ